MPHRRFVVGGLVGAVAVAALVVALLLGGGGHASGPKVGVPVPAEDLAHLVAAAGACPSLTPARLAGQIMANSGFDPGAATRPGRTGLAGLTDAQWQRWAPRPDADRDSPADQIHALAHLMCDLVGQLRTVASTTDRWRLALAGFVVGPEPVVAANGIPAGDAAAYVSTVVEYASWYQARFAASAQASAAADPTTISSPAPTADIVTSTSTAPPPTAPAGTRSAYGTIQAESADAQSGAATEVCSDTGGGLSVGFLAPGDWLRYNKLDFGATSATTIAVRYAGDLPAGMTGTVQVRLDSPQASPIGAVSVVSTGGWQSWITLTAGVTPTSGVHDVYLTVTSSNGWEIGNLNWFSFRR